MKSEMNQTIKKDLRIEGPFLFLGTEYFEEKSI